MNFLTLQSNSSDSTMKISKVLAKHLKKGDILVLTGELGARKNQVYRRIFKLLWVRR